MAKEYYIGKLVCSKAGRDKGKYYIITDILEDSRYVYVVDGIYRPLEKPKKKKIKHLMFTNINLRDINKDQIVDKFNNPTIKKFIQSHQFDKEV